jgi:hypothetical protein
LSARWVTTAPTVGQNHQRTPGSAEDRPRLHEPLRRRPDGSEGLEILFSLAGDQLDVVMIRVHARGQHGEPGFTQLTDGRLQVRRRGVEPSENLDRGHALPTGEDGDTEQHLPSPAATGDRVQAPGPDGISHEVGDALGTRGGRSSDDENQVVRRLVRAHHP